MNGIKIITYLRSTFCVIAAFIEGVDSKMYKDKTKMSNKCPKRIANKKNTAAENWNGAKASE